MTEPEDEIDPMLTLFRAEVRDQTAALSRGLLAVDRDPNIVSELAQAAHILRGAARIVNLDLAARLAAGLESLFSAIVAGQRTLGPSEADVCQRAVTRFGELEHTDPTTWATDHAADVEALIAAFNGQDRLASVLRTDANPPPPKPEPIAFTTVSLPAVVDAESPLPNIDPTLLELFREEVRSHAAGLSSGLLELEREPTNPQRIEPLMRAAHSLKGACRIVGLDAAVELAHELEDVFVAAQAGKVRITPAGIDSFLRAADVLAALGDGAPGQWIATHRTEVTELRNAALAIKRGEAPPERVQPIVVEEPKPVVAANLPEAKAIPTHTTTESAAPPVEESVVRVTAQSLNRLMSLAGESLVQARWLQPFASSLLELKKLQDQIAARLDAVAQGLPTGPASDRANAVVTDARELSARCRQVLADRIGEFEDHAGQAEDLNSRLYREVIVSRMRPFSDGAHGFPRLVRDTARRLGKQVRFDLIGQTTEVDRDILEKLEAPLTHLLRNAVDHGMETPDVREAAGKPAEGVVRVEARHRGGMLSIAVSEDGGGIDVEMLRRKIAERGLTTADMASRMTDAELLEFLFLPGFSTAAKVTEVSGRGVGLDVVQDTLRKVGGSVQISTTLGKGTTFHLMLPLTLSVVRAVLVEVAGEPYAFPHNRIDRLIRVPWSDVRSLQHRQFVTVDGRNVGLVLASQLLDLTDQPTPPGADLPVLLLSDVGGTYGLIVDAFRGEQDLVVRPLDSRLGKVPNVSAAAILDDGSPVLIADVEDLIRSMDQYIQTGTLRRCDPATAQTTIKKRVLVVDDSITVREVQKQTLRTRGYEVEVAVDGQDGWNMLRADRFDLVVSDVDMPRMTGLELVRRIRDDAKMREIPVVIVSYKDREEDRLRGLEAGANYYLTKSSFHDDSFMEAVVALIGPA